jgi:hypothetical protein
VDIYTYTDQPGRITFVGMFTLTCQDAVQLWVCLHKPVRTQYSYGYTVLIRTCGYVYTNLSGRSTAVMLCHSPSVTVWSLNNSATPLPWSISNLKLAKYCTARSVQYLSKVNYQRVVTEYFPLLPFRFIFKNKKNQKEFLFFDIFVQKVI